MSEDDHGYTAPHRFRVIHNADHYELWVEDRVATFDSQDELERCVKLIRTQAQPTDEP